MVYQNLNANEISNHQNDRDKNQKSIENKKKKRNKKYCVYTVHSTEYTVINRQSQREFYLFKRLFLSR